MKASANDVQDRVSELIKALEMTPNFFSGQIGTSQTNIHNIVAGRRSAPSYETLQKILAAFPQINTDWLIRGEGPMFRYAAPSDADAVTQTEEHSFHYGLGAAGNINIQQHGKGKAKQKISQLVTTKEQTAGLPPANMPNYADMYAACVQERSALEKKLRETQDEVIAMLKEKLQPFTPPSVQ